LATEAKSMTKLALFFCQSYPTPRMAIATFQPQPDYRSRCYEALPIKNPGLIIDGLDQLAVDFGLARTE